MNKNDSFIQNEGDVFCSSKIKEFENWLNSFLNFEKFPQKNMFWLDTMEYFSKKADRANLFCKTFHVAGSKGKGSTSAFIASILEQANIRTGLYTSPHILNFLERITENQKFFSQEVYEEAAEELVSLVENAESVEFLKNRPITWFELVTLYSFLCFRKAKVECAIFEVGLGGRLDATNVIKPKVCCIGPIELEHTEYLGDTVEKIAQEKGGIIKENTPVVIAKQKQSVKEIFKKIAKEKNAPIFFIDEICSNISTKIHVVSDENKSDCPDINKACQENFPVLKMKTQIDSKIFSRKLKTDLKLLGDFQAENAALAAIAVKLAFPEIPESTIEKGLEKTKLPGRFEILDTQKIFKELPFIILDGAHTPRSVAFTLKTIDEAKLNVKNLLFACAEDKKIDEIAELFKGFSGKIFLTIPGTVKKSDLKKVENAFSSKGIKFHSDSNYIQQIKNAIGQSKNDKTALLVTGSFYLVAEVKKYIKNLYEDLS
ncbi:bifunctional folylpolyglutamate synthase/dihydrofolate synthase [Treponema pectinovorum]|uniref:bifunctional folylpolyglutamate synthase/dihydrofolate synthase n=1 Tax=Treponema pectinovorum TaxID=164 RepID=UPI003D8D81BB